MRLLANGEAEQSSVCRSCVCVCHDHKNQFSVKQYGWFIYVTILTEFWLLHS